MQNGIPNVNNCFIQLKKKYLYIVQNRGNQSPTSLISHNDMFFLRRQVFKSSHIHASPEAGRTHAPPRNVNTYNSVCSIRHKSSYPWLLNHYIL